MAESGSTHDAALLEEIRERYDYATAEWDEVRAEGRKDMRYVSGDPWEAKDRQARVAAGRPCLALDELGQYVNQLINDVRQNKRAIQVTPIGLGANDKTAEFRANLIRQIEYRSNAQQTYTTMFENAVQRSYGFLRVKSRYVSDRDPNRHQELILEPFVNPDLVTIDPDIQMPDGADMRYGFVGEWWPIKEFKRAFPKAKVISFSDQLFPQAQRSSYVKWVSAERVLLSEYWKIKTEKKPYYDLELDGRTNGHYDGDEPPKGWEKAEKKGERELDKRSVCQYLTNGFEILKTTEWPGKDIPIVCCFGKVIYVDDGAGSKRKILSMIRLARDPYMLYCYYRTGQAELVGMSTKFPYFVRRGSLLPAELEKIQASLHEPVAVIQVEAVGDGIPAGQMPEMPVRNPFTPEIQAFEVGAEGARRAIQAAMGISPLPTSAQRKNEKSGVALKQMRDAEQQGSFHFIDHYEASITRAGAILNDLIPHYYDAARDVTVRDSEDRAKVQRINDPNDPQAISAVDGDHDVTLSTGPALDSEREASSDFADTLVQGLDKIAAIAGPQVASQILGLSIRLKNIGAVGTKIADMISPAQDDKGAAPTPKEQQMMQAGQQLQAKLQEATQIIQTDQVKQQAQIQIAQMNNDAKIKIAEMQMQANLVATEAKINSSDAQAMVKAEMERFKIEIHEQIAHIVHAKDQAHERGMHHADAAHEAGLQADQQRHERELAQRQHEQALEQGDQGHQQALEQQTQAAELAPEPEAEE